MRGTRAAAAVVAGLLLAILPAAGPAVAHDKKLKLQVAGDGATGVTVQAGHADGHPLDGAVRLVLSATGANGRKVGPLQLQPAGEGQGFYTSGPVLAPGDWRVTVSAPAPYSGGATAEVRAKAAQSAPPQAAPVAARKDGPASGGFSWWWLGALGVLAAVAIAGTLWAAGRRARTRGAPEV